MEQSFEDDEKTASTFRAGLDTSRTLGGPDRTGSFRRLGSSLRVHSCFRDESLVYVQRRFSFRGRLRSVQRRHDREGRFHHRGAQRRWGSGLGGRRGPRGERRGMEERRLSAKAGETLTILGYKNGASGPNLRQKLKGSP